VTRARRRREAFAPLRAAGSKPPPRGTRAKNLKAPPAEVSSCQRRFS
jgi:hypothetical protein